MINNPFVHERKFKLRFYNEYIATYLIIGLIINCCIYVLSSIYVFLDNTYWAFYYFHCFDFTTCGFILCFQPPLEAKFNSKNLIPLYSVYPAPNCIQTNRLVNTQQSI